MRLIDADKIDWRGLTDCQGKEYARYLIEHLPEAKPMEWISVKERLPKCNVPCLICIDGKPQTECASIDCYDDEIIWFWTNNDFESEGEVTHWMPLPEPPKE